MCSRVHVSCKKHTDLCVKSCRLRQSHYLTPSWGSSLLSHTFREEKKKDNERFLSLLPGRCSWDHFVVWKSCIDHRRRNWTSGTQRIFIIEEKRLLLICFLMITHCCNCAVKCRILAVRHTTVSNAFKAVNVLQCNRGDRRKEVSLEFGFPRSYAKRLKKKVTLISFHSPGS